MPEKRSVQVRSIGKVERPPVLSSPPPLRQGVAKMAGNASRYLFLFLIGLVVGIVGAVMTMRAIDARSDHFPGSVMGVMAWHMGQLKRNTEQNHCAATDTLPHVQALRLMANDIEPAFGDLRDDQRFSKHASDLRASL